MRAPTGYVPLFDPNAETQPFDRMRAHRLGDRNPVGDLPYVYDDDITLAVNVALAAGRPLLVRGEPGTGKSSLARSVATLLGWRFYTDTVSSRTCARDLLWTFDTVGRLADAQALQPGGQMPPPQQYLQPGVLWWAFDRELARDRGLTGTADGLTPAKDPTPLNPDSERSVVLIDEIDKADPDVPNDLLVPLGEFQFQIVGGPLVKATHTPLIIITTNEERELPRALQRRRVTLTLPQPDPARLARIAHAHFPNLADHLLDSVRDAYLQLRTERVDQDEPPPSVAEFLDAIASCKSLRLNPRSANWASLAAMLLAKVAPGTAQVS